MSASDTQSLSDSLPEDLPDPKGSRLLLLVIVLSLSALLVWASFATIDQVTRAPAQFIAAERTQIVQAADGGVITKLHVKEGEKVRKGQLLVTLEKERAAAAFSDSTAKVAALRTAIVRLEAELFGKPLKFDPELLRYDEYVRNQTQLYQRKQTALKEEVGSLANILEIAQQELQINQQLVGTGDVSRAEYLRLQKNVAELRSQISNRRNKYFQEAQAEMTKVREELNTLKEQVRDRAQLLEHTELLAPSDGVVNNIRATTHGAVIRPGDVVMELLPTGGDLIAETKVNPADIAFVEVGQSALVKVDAFDSTVFGGLRGEVSYISPDVLKEDAKEGPLTYYRVHILIKENEFRGEQGKGIRLRPGLTGQVEIKAMERTVLSFLTKPIVKTLSNSMGER